MKHLVIALVLVSISVAEHYRRCTMFALSSPMTFPIHQVEDFVIVYPAIAGAAR